MGRQLEQRCWIKETTMSGGRLKVKLTVITTKPWIWAIIKCEPWTKVSFGIKCFLERHMVCSARIQPVIKSGQKGSWRAANVRSFKGLFRGGGSDTVFLFFFSNYSTYLGIGRNFNFYLHCLLFSKTEFPVIVLTFDSYVQVISGFQLQFDKISMKVKVSFVIFFQWQQCDFLFYISQIVIGQNSCL